VPGREGVHPQVLGSFDEAAACGQELCKVVVELVSAVLAQSARFK
jgi:hypothetical protein